MSSLAGVSPWTRRTRADIVRIAPLSSTVLITGPTGTGKELIARAIHTQSPRVRNPFIPVDCTSITGPLFASQLFGHRKGAFTGADYEALGCFRAAHQGSLFLDEIGELDYELQAKLLRVIQEKTVVPIGYTDGERVDVRIVAATNRDLKAEVVAGRFREDLYYRLAVVSLETTPLRQRPEDVAILARNFLAELATEGGMPLKELSPGAEQALEMFEWPGNVRQLRHVLHQAAICVDGPLLTQPAVQAVLDKAAMPPSEGQGTLPLTPPPDTVARDPRGPITRRDQPQTNHLSDVNDEQWTTLYELERQHVVATLEHTYYNQSAASRLLGLTRQALIRKMKKFRIIVPSSVRRKVRSESLPHK